MGSGGYAGGMGGAGEAAMAAIRAGRDRDVTTNAAAVVERALSTQNPCSDFAEELGVIEFPGLPGELMDDIVPPEGEIGLPPTPQGFLTPLENITTPSQRVSRIKTLINQGIFFHLSASERILAVETLGLMGKSSLGPSLDLLSAGLTGVSHSPYGLMHPHTVDGVETTSNFMLYPAHAVPANREQSDEKVLNIIDTLRYILRRSWMRHTSGAAVFQDTGTGTSREVPFSFSLYSRNPDVDGRAQYMLALFHKRNRFERIPKNLVGLPLAFEENGVTLATGGGTYGNKWQTSSALLQLYVYGSTHPLYSQLGDVEKVMYSTPLVPMGKKFIDIVHDTKMPFHKTELENLPPTRYLDVSVRVGTNFITDKFANDTSSETSKPNAYCMYAIDSGRRESGQRATGINVRFTSDNVKEFETIYEKQKHMSPMYTNIQFATHQGTRVAGFIKDTKFDNKILDLLSSFESIAVDERAVYAEIMDEITAPEAAGIATTVGNLNDEISQGQERKTIDIIQWISGLTSAPDEDDSAYPLGLYNADLHDALPAERDFIRQLYKAVFSSKVKNFCIPRARSYQKLMQGEKAYSETIAYKIEKYLISPGENPQLRQRFFIIDNDDIDRINFLDTQVNYGVRYEYRIFAYNLVVGTEYEYTCLDTVNPPQNIGATAALETYFHYHGYRVVREKPNFPSGWAYVDNTQPVPESASSSGAVRKGSVQHTLILNEQVRDRWFQNVRSNQEPAPAAVGRSVRWTGRIAWTTLSGRRPPSEEEVNAEFDRRQAAARLVATRINARRVSESLQTIQEAQGAYPDQDSQPTFDSYFGTGGTSDPLYVSVESAPKIVLVEVPFFRKEVVMEDAPPVFPQVHFVPYKGDTSTVRINLSANIGEYDMIPVIMDSSDADMVEEIRLAQDTGNSPFLKYKTDNPPIGFDVMRLDTPPETILDFLEGDYFYAATGGFSGSVYDDLILPNKKYYYTFRAVDSGGKRSNPTDVYCCQIVSTENGMYLDVYMYDMNDVAQRKTEEFKRLLYIRPAVIQRTFEGDMDIPTSGEDPLSLPEGASAEEPVLGLYDKKIWNKKYKIRIKSKKSGKKVDLNIKFEKKLIDYTVGITMSPDESTEHVARNAAGTRSSTNSPLVIGQGVGSDIKFTPAGGNRKDYPGYK